LQDTHKVLQSNIQVTEELGVTKQKIDDEGRVDLTHDGVLGVADEGLDLQILLDEAEEDLDLPALLVDVGDGLGRQPEVVGEEHVNFFAFRVLVNDAAQGLGALPAFSAGKLDSLIGHQSQGAFDGAPPQPPVAGIALLPGDKEDFLGGELAIPGIVGITQVLHDDGTLGEVKGPGFFDLMLPGRGDGHKGRQVAVVVQQGVELDPRPGAPKRGPGKQGQAEAYHGGIQAVELVFKLELVLRGQRLTAPVHRGKQRRKKGGGALVVSIGKGGTGHRLDSQMVEALEAGFQTGDAISQTRSGRKLHGKQVYQLAPSAKRSGLSAGPVLGFQLGKMMSRNEFEHLMKDCVTMGHGPESPVCLESYAKPILTDSQEFSGLF